MAEAKATNLKEWLDYLVQSKYRTMTALAKVAGRKGGPMVRNVEETGSAGLEPLLRLAADTGESPSYVLGIAKKADLDELLQRLYGAPSPTLPDDVQRVVDFLLLKDGNLQPLQALMKEAAARELARSQASIAEGGDGDRPAKSSKRPKHDTQKR